METFLKGERALWRKEHIVHSSEAAKFMVFVTWHLSIGSNPYFSFTCEVTSLSASLISRRDWSKSKHRVCCISDVFHQNDQKRLLKHLACSAVFCIKQNSGQIPWGVLTCLYAGSVLRLLLELRRSTKNVCCGFSHFPFIFVGRQNSQEFCITEEGLINAAVLTVLQHSTGPNYST